MAKRKAVGFLISEMGLSERRACRIVGLARSVQQYQPLFKDDAAAITAASVSRPVITVAKFLNPIWASLACALTRSLIVWIWSLIRIKSYDARA